MHNPLFIQIKSMYQLHVAERCVPRVSAPAVQGLLTVRDFWIFQVADRGDRLQPVLRAHHVLHSAGRHLLRLFAHSVGNLQEVAREQR
jgi:hypothetical protein